MSRYIPQTLPPGTLLYFATERDEFGNDVYVGGPLLLGPSGETLPEPIPPSYASAPSLGVTQTNPEPVEPPGSKIFNESIREGVSAIDGGVRKQSTGPLAPVNASGWDDSDRVKVSNDVRASDYNFGEDFGAVLEASGFDFSSIPEGATITGIKVRVERSKVPDSNPPAPPVPPFGETFTARDGLGVTVKSGRGSADPISVGGHDGRIFMCTGGNSLYSTDGGLTYIVGPNMFTETGWSGNKIASSDTEFLAVATGLKVSDSTDGLTWDAVGEYGAGVPDWTAGVSSAWAKKRDGYWLAGKFGLGHFAYSLNKTSWNSNNDIESASGGMEIQGFEFNGSLWMAIGESKCCTAPDLTGPWTYRTGFGASNTNWGRGGSIGGGVTWNGTVWLGFDWNSTNMATSPDGITWTSRTANIIAGGWNSLEDVVSAHSYGGTIYLGGADGTFAYSHDDGATWTVTSDLISAGLGAVDVSGIEVVDGNIMVILGDASSGVFTSP